MLDLTRKLRRGDLSPARDRLRASSLLGKYPYLYDQLAMRDSSKRVARAKHTNRLVLSECGCMPCPSDNFQPLWTMNKSSFLRESLYVGLYVPRQYSDNSSSRCLSGIGASLMSKLLRHNRSTSSTYCFSQLTVFSRGCCKD